MGAAGQRAHPEGGAATLRLTVGQSIPFALFYQYAYRGNQFGGLHIAGIGF
ncbi:hypothetical protein [Corallococcus exercitus]|uniref:Uncharacterized protein n=1 Tax=Corallococcus exercitus TaxID=2316736 RepID=A0A7Y4KSP8_9BACT|nr:hypothetical protein [Corallococcus exercitus]NOK39117.1 hypothetical protein [Corallococcus exercitus]